VSFYVILSTESSFIGLKWTFFVITPTPKFWRWRGNFYRIEYSHHRHRRRQNLQKEIRRVSTLAGSRETSRTFLQHLRPQVRLQQQRDLHIRKSHGGNNSLLRSGNLEMTITNEEINKIGTSEETKTNVDPKKDPVVIK
jgi:hypothetical protein